MSSFMISMVPPKIEWRCRLHKKLNTVTDKIVKNYRFQHISPITSGWQSGRTSQWLGHRSSTLVRSIVSGDRRIMSLAC